jgi:hypothetical protein
MPNDTITLELSGEVYLEDFVKAMRELRSLVNGLSKDVAGGAKLDWSVDYLEGGSATATLRGVANDEDEQRYVAEIVKAYGEVGRALETGSEIPYSRGVAKAAHEIVSILNGRIDEILFETEETEAHIRSLDDPATWRSPSRFYAYGAVQGRLHTLSSRKGLRFVLYDVFGNAIRCYVPEAGDTMRERVRKAWDGFVVVEGKVHRDASGKPVSISEITDVVIRESGEKDGYRLAMGAIRSAPDAPTPEETIRRLRDA